MYCDQCGKQIDDDSRFCRHCGAAQKPLEASSVADEVAAEAAQAEAPDIQPPAQKSATGLVLGFIAVAVILLIIVSSLGRSPGSGDTANVDAAADNIEMAVANLMTAQNELPGNTDVTPASGASWSYSTDEDKVRGSTSYFASTTSTNMIHQDAPYDGSTSMRMMVRKSPAHGTDVILTISSGQMMCPSYQGCSGTVRFDDGPAQRVSFAGPADSSSETIFVEGASSFIAKLKKSKKVIIEKTLYQAGSPQFEFNTEGLKWDH